MSRLTQADFWQTSTRGIGDRPINGWYPGPTEELGNNIANVPGNVLRADVALFTSQHSMHVVTMTGVSFASATSCFIRFGIYEADENCFPSTRVYDSGEMTAPDGGGIITAQPSYTLQPRRLYWLATLTNSSWYRQERGFSLDWSILGQGSSTAGLAGAYAVVASHGYGALPASFPTANTSLNGDGARLVVTFA